MRKANEDGREPWLALLDHRNTPTECMRSSPAQRLRTLLPARETLLIPQLAENVQEERKKIKRKQAFHYSRNAKDLPPLVRGDSAIKASKECQGTMKESYSPGTSQC